MLTLVHTMHTPPDTEGDLPDDPSYLYPTRPAKVRQGKQGQLQQ